MLKPTPNPGTARVKFNYSLYKIFKLEARVLYYSQAWSYYWCYDIIPLITKGTAPTRAKRIQLKDTVTKPSLA